MYNFVPAESDIDMISYRYPEHTLCRLYEVLLSGNWLATENDDMIVLGLLRRYGRYGVTSPAWFLRRDI